MHLINSWKWTIQAHLLFCWRLCAPNSGLIIIFTFPTERIQFTLLPRPPTTKRSTDSSCLVGNLWKQEQTYFLNLCRDLDQAGANSSSLEKIRLKGKMANSCELLVRRWSPALSTCQLGRCSSAGWLVPVVGGDHCHLLLLVPPTLQTSSTSSSSPVVPPPCILRQAKQMHRQRTKTKLNGTQDISLC